MSGAAGFGFAACLDVDGSPALGSGSESGAERHRSRSRSPRRAGPEKPLALQWAKLGVTQMGLSLEPFQTKLDDPIVLTTGCSGSGAPTHALEQLLGETNIREIASSEWHASTRAWFLQNFNPERCYHNIEFARTGGYCEVAKTEIAHLLDAGKDLKEDLYVVGFTCKAYSQESVDRYHYAAVSDMFSPHGPNAWKIVPFYEAVSHIRRRRPRFYVLENVLGCLKKRSNVDREDEWKCPLDYILNGRSAEDNPVGLMNSVDGYGLRVISLTSKEFGLPMNRGRLYFIGAELLDTTGEPTGNSEATLDLIAHVLTTALRDPYLDDKTTLEHFVKYLNDLDIDYPDQEYPQQRKGRPLSDTTSTWLSNMKRKMGIDDFSADRFEEHSRSARAEVPDWELGIRPREEMMVNLTYCMAKTTGLNVNSLVLDIVKSYDRKAYRSDGLLPPLTTNSRLYYFKEKRLLQGYELLGMHGFDITKLHFDGFVKPTLWSMLAGNAMSVPVVGSVLLSVLLYGDFGDSRRHFRLGRVPTPTSQATTLVLPGQDSTSGTDDDDDDIDSD